MEGDYIGRVKPRDDGRLGRVVCHGLEGPGAGAGGGAEDVLLHRFVPQLTECAALKIPPPGAGQPMDRQS